MVSGIMPLTVGTILALLIIRWRGVRFENEQSPSRDEKDTALHKESSVNLRDLFFFPFVSAIVAAVVRWIPVNYWYGSFFDQNRAWHFLTLVGIFAACLVAVVVMSLWTIFSRTSIVVRWLLPIPNTVVKLSEPMIVPTSAKVGIAGFFNNNKARLQKCKRAFFVRQCRTVFQTVTTLRLQLFNAGPDFYSPGRKGL